MPVSTITSKGQTTVPKEVRDALEVARGDTITWEIRGGHVAVTAERPRFWRWAGAVSGGPDDAVEAVAQARKRRGRV